MRVVKAKAGHIEYEHDGPPRLMVADIHGGEVTLIIHDHPEDDEYEMRHLQKMLIEARQQHAKHRKVPRKEN